MRASGKRRFNANERWFLTPTRSIASLLKLFIFFHLLKKYLCIVIKKIRYNSAFAPLHLREKQSKTQICKKKSKLHVYLFIAESCCLQEQCIILTYEIKKVAYFKTKSSSFSQTRSRKVQINLNRNHYCVVI